MTLEGFVLINQMTMSSNAATLNLSAYWSFNEGGIVYNGSTSLAVAKPSILTATMLNQAIINAAKTFFDAEFGISVPLGSIHIVPGVSLPAL